MRMMRSQHDGGFDKIRAEMTAKQREQQLRDALRYGPAVPPPLAAEGIHNPSWRGVLPDPYEREIPVLEKDVFEKLKIEHGDKKGFGRVVGQFRGSQ